MERKRYFRAPREPARRSILSAGQFSRFSSLMRREDPFPATGRGRSAGNPLRNALYSTIARNGTLLGEPDSVRILLIAEEHLVCAALKALVTSWRAVHVIGDAATTDEAVAQLRRDTPDVILLSLAGSDEVDRKLVSDIVQLCGRARLIVLVGDCNEEFRSHLVGQGATAVVPRTAHPSTLQKTIAENCIQGIA